MKKKSRREFIAAGSTAALSAMLAASRPAFGFSRAVGSKPALLGGEPVRSRPFAAWPVWDEQDESAILPVLRSGVWSRDAVVTRAEQKYAALMGARYCLLTSNGTQALITALHALGIEGGDEVITTPYTFVATIDAILLNNALPVFVDVDPDTWQIDADRIEAKITPATRALLPVHILGGICHMDKINAIAAQHDLRIVEDACEAHLAEWKGKRAGTLGYLGCFSLQNGKQITCGEGGAILGDDERVMELCYSFHNFGRIRGKHMPTDKGASPILGTKCRASEYQASILITQMESAVAETRKRHENACYLSAKLKTIPGIVPRKDYAQTNLTSYYYYGFRFKEQEFGLSRAAFVKAMRAEGIALSTGLGVIEGGPMYREGVMESTLTSRTFRKLYPPQRLDEVLHDDHFPHCEQLVQETVGLHQGFLLGSRADMDDVRRATEKIYENRKALAKVAL
ncbi:DegT/DnrJ/EryC1/StrS family aminotransferase [bacterium]|nr:DegT/DnrJ/EryC1/StrS family aminotransferase [bacterium]